MKTTIFRNPNNLNIDEVINVFKDELETKEAFSNSDINELVEVYAKNPVDKFVITETLTHEAGQGDILIFAENTDLYKSYIKEIKTFEKTNRLVLQEGDSFTGDHRIVPLEGSKYTISTGKFCPNFLKGKRRWGSDVECTAIVFETDKPFLIFHREHGNVALPKGRYMFCSQLDPKTLSRMMD